LNETGWYFIAVCPRCTVNQKVAADEMGRHVRCGQCQHIFRAGEARRATGPASAEHDFMSGRQDAGSVDRIAVSCPGCQATLRVRRSYIGNQVRCNHCDRAFVVTGADGPPLAVGPAEGDLEGDSVMIVPRQTNGRAYLGIDEAHSLATERDSLRAELDHLRDELNGAADRIVQLQTELGDVGSERDALALEIEKRDQHLESLRSENGSTAIERESARQEIEQLRVALAAAAAQYDSLTQELEERDEQLEQLRIEQGRATTDRETARL
jgi:hypothetical protein